jgi:hypothetical protein
MVGEINKEENKLVRELIGNFISRVETKKDCIFASKMITCYALEGYDVCGLNEELFYRKERWLVDIYSN